MTNPDPNPRGIPRSPDSYTSRRGTRGFIPSPPIPQFGEIGEVGESQGVQSEGSEGAGRRPESVAGPEFRFRCLDCSRPSKGDSWLCGRCWDALFRVRQARRGPTDADPYANASDSTRVLTAPASFNLTEPN